MQETIDTFDPFEAKPAQQSLAPRIRMTPTESPSEFDPFDVIESDTIAHGAQALDGDAMKAAESRGIAAKLGTTRTAVDMDFDNMKSMAQKQTRKDALTSAPSAAQWFRDHPYDAPAFQDDTSLVASIEEGLSEIGSSIKRGYQSGRLLGEQGGAWASLGDRAPSKEFVEEDRKRDAELRMLQGDDTGFLFSASQVVGTMIQSFAEGYEGGAAMAALGTAAMAANAVPVAGQALAGASALGAAAYGTYRIEGGLNLKEQYDAGVEYDKAAAVASGVGLLNSLTELAGLHILGKAAKPVLDPIMAKFGSKATAALEDLTVRQALVGAGKSLALGTGQEVATEVIQEVNSIVGEELGKAWSGIDSELKAEAFFDRLQETAIQTAKAMVVLGGISAGPVMYSNMAKVNRAKANKATLDRIIEAHKQARATQLTPDAAQELLDAQATDAGISQVWVDAQAFSQAMIDHGVTKQDLKQILPEVAEQIDSASANGGDIVLPTARYASALGGTELGIALNDHVRFEQNGLSNAEAVEVEAAYKQLRVDAIREQVNPQLAEDAEDTAIQADPTKTPEQKAQEIQARDAQRKLDSEARKAYEDRLVEQMQAANFTGHQARTQAKFAGAIVSNLAKRLNIPVQAAVDRYGVNVAVNDAVEETSVSQAAIDKFALQRRSYAFDEELAKWKKGEGDSAFDLGTPSWVLQIFGVDPKTNLVAKQSQFVHVLFPKNVVVTVDGKTVEGDHDIPVDELRGLLVAIQQPLAVFRSRKKQKKGTFSIVLLTELTREIKGEKKNIVVPILLTGRRDGKTMVVNEISSAYEKRDLRGWMNDLLGVEKTKGLEAVHQVLGSISSAGDSSRPVGGGPTPTHRSPSEAKLPDNIIVYENSTSIGDMYQGGDGIRGSFTPTENRITLTPQADLSTFSHEIGHWYLNTLFDVVRQGQATTTVADDVQAVLKEFGIADLASWDALGFEGQRKYHEQFASWTEQYLAEGKSPAGLKKFFMNLGRWIRDVYRDFTGGVEEATRARYRQEIGEELPELSDEVRLVLDRMVAAERIVNESVAAESLHPLFDTKPADMTEETWLDMQMARAEAGEAAMTELISRRARDDKWYAGARARLMREKNKEAKEYRASVREKVERKINGRKEFTARDILSSGGAKFGFDNLKVNPENVRELGFSDRTVAKLQTMGVLKKDGLTVEQARSLLEPMARFSSAKGLIRGLLVTEDREQMIEQETTQRCLERKSELFNPQELDRSITAALHNEARARLVATELKYLTGDQRVNPRVLAEAARRAARDLLDRTQAKNFSARTMMTLESRASRKAYKAIAAGNRLEAAIYKRQQLVYHEAASLAVGLEKKKTKFKNLRRLVFKSDKGLAQTYDTNVLAIARAVLANRGYGERSAGELVPAETYLEKARKYDPDLVVGLDAYLKRHPFTFSNARPGTESAGDLLRMVEDLEALVKLAREQRQTELNGKKVLIDEAVEELTTTAADQKSEYTPSTKRAISKWEKGTKLWLTSKAYLRRVENWCITMDHGDTDGPFTRYIFRPVVNAAAAYRTKNVEMQGRLVEILERQRKQWDKVTDIEAPELNYTFQRKSELIGAILHTGNRSNLEKLLIAGRGEDARWADVTTFEDGRTFVDTSRWDKFIARCYQQGIITKEDMDVVQAVWDLLEEIKPMTQNAFRDYYGYYFEEIPATPVVTPFGVYRGGYVPAAADIDRVAQGDKQLERDFFDSSTEFLDQMPVTRPGFTHSRTNVTRPLSLNLGFLSSHVQKAVKFSMMAPTIKQVQRVIKNRDFVETINNINPQIIGEMLEPWLRRSATQSVTTPTDIFGRGLNRLRALAGVSLMAGNIANAIQQVTGFSVAMSQVGAKPLMMALARYAMHPVQTYRDVKEASPFMKARLENFEYEYQNRIETLAQTDRPSTLKSFRDWTMRHAYCLQTWMQILVDTPTWMAAFDKAVAEGRPDEQAIYYADSVVRRTQSSFDPESVARVETGSPLGRAVLVFYNYFNMQANLLGDSWARNVKTGRYGQFVIDLALVMAVPAILSELIVQAFNGFDTGDDDDWDAYDAAKLVISPVVKNAVALVPYGGQLVNAGATQLSRIGDNEEGMMQLIFAPNTFNDKLVSIPAASLIENTFKAIKQLGDAAWGEEVDARTATRNTLDALTLTTGIPFAGLKRPLGYAAGVVAGDIEPENPVDAARGVLSGRDVNAD
jgi:hypothetical protein|nr:MAG TPA_asm: crystallin beta/gamma motif-containing protein [Caudoviricetes sp.]